MESTQRTSTRDTDMREKPFSLPTSLFLAVLCTACVATSHTWVDPSGPRFDPVPPDSVVIFTDEAELEGVEYTRLALIEATGSGEFTDQSGMLKAMRKKAGELGANAILLPKIEEPGAGAKVAAAFLGTGTQRKGNVVAIRIHE